MTKKHYYILPRAEYHSYEAELDVLLVELAMLFLVKEHAGYSIRIINSLWEGKPLQNVNSYPLKTNCDLSEVRAEKVCEALKLYAEVVKLDYYRHFWRDVLYDFAEFFFQNPPDRYKRWYTDVNTRLLKLVLIWLTKQAHPDTEWIQNLTGMYQYINDLHKDTFPVIKSELLAAELAESYFGGNQELALKVVETVRQYVQLYYIGEPELYQKIRIDFADVFTEIFGTQGSDDVNS